MRKSAPRILSMVVGICVAAGCAHQDAAPRTGKPKVQKPRVDVLIDESLMDEPEAEKAFAIWGVYGFGLAEGYEADEGEPAIRDRFPGLRMELRGRESMAKVTKERLHEGKASIPYAERQLALAEAKLLLEYVLYTMSEPGWYVLPGEIAAADLDRFAAWVAEHQGHVPQRRAWIVWDADRPVDLPVPGSWADELMASRSQECAASLRGLFEGVVRWRKEAASLEAVPIAAYSKPHFVESLRLLRDSDPAMTKGVIWVDPALAPLHFRAGFCAIDAGWIDRAIEPLRTAVALDPLRPLFYSELAFALATTKRHSEALQVVEEGLQITKDPCSVAALLRERGWNYIQLGELPLARLAYLQSLEFDPEDDTAPKQLGIIEGIARSSDQSLVSADPSSHTPPPILPPLKAPSCEYKNLDRP